ncbi:uncharacterized protein [Triticum aestivum]|uniref:Uncharacterized protein n=1 Tax=Triticum aestivum TaxID=4565 RepID=A0A3B6FUB5_WHEAT|nr:uncharacterized protein LOC123066039 [Triticum aestivum]
MEDMSTQVVSPAAAGVMSEVAVLVNALSIVIDLGPLFVLLFPTDWKEVSKFFSLKSFILSTVMNFFLASHVLFEIDEKDKHRDVLFVSVVGFCTATVFAFFLLAHRGVMKNSRWARCWMAYILLCFVIACLVLLGGIFVEFQGYGPIISVLGFLVVLVLNAATVAPVLTCKPLPDDEVTFYTVFMSFLNALDSSFFVFYAVCLGTFGRFLSLVSLMNALGALILLIGLIVTALLKGLRRLLNFIFSFGGHHRND